VFLRKPISKVRRQFELTAEMIARFKKAARD
jgi:hypothetical protein